MKQMIELDENDSVLRVLTAHEDFTADEMIDLTSRLSNKKWVLIKGDRLPAIGMKYEHSSSKFFFQSPFPSWEWCEKTWSFCSPKASPSGKVPYVWDETIRDWKESSTTIDKEGVNHGVFK